MSDAVSAVDSARRIMEAFAARTGLSPRGPQTRYLWTDAFALCNCLTLLRRTRDEGFRELAIQLIDRVHHVLGRHREDDPREGWISGLGEEEGERHPTVGGLRIGKRLNERRPGDPYDARLEWERDGQYYHYLVRWIHALAQAGRVLGSETYFVWAVELAEAAHGAFAHEPYRGAPRRLVWKMSIDLTRELVPSEGAHDPLDGFVTASSLRASLPRSLSPSDELDGQIHELAGMCAGRAWATEDPLGAGGLLMDACWVTRLLRVGAGDRTVLQSLAPSLWEDCLVSLASVARGYPLERAPAERLAFRELGLAIGLLGVELLGDPSEVLPPGADRTVEAVRRHVPLAERIVGTWLEPSAREAESWTSHGDINAVMLATALVPDEYLGL